MDSGFIQVALIFPVLLFSLCVHEYAHAWVAVRLGDHTPASEGRLTLFPWAHADFMGTLMLPIFCLYYGWPFIGWAKPVPVNHGNMRGGRRSMALVAAAGPGSNVVLALLSALCLGIVAGYAPDGPIKATTLLVCRISLQLNVILAVFNLLPVPPLDGYMILGGLLPERVLPRLYQVARYGFVILLALFFTGAFAYLVGEPAHAVTRSLLRLASLIAN